MLTVGAKFPETKLKAVVSTDPASAFTTLDEADFKGKWRIVFFYPKDFTFVCPTEIAGFARLNDAFEERETKIVAVSTDSEFVHLAWRKSHADLADVPFPMASDIDRSLSEELGILDAQERVCPRATFIVDAEGVIRHVSVNDGSVGRSPEEILRILDALQTDELCPCSWKKGDPTLQVS